MNKDISIIIPSIRPQNLLKVYDSLVGACTRHTFELIVASPYYLPGELLKKGNVKYIHTYANPTICFQMSALLASSTYIYNLTDDGLVEPNAIDTALEFMDYMPNKDMYNARYDEGILNKDTLEVEINKGSEYLDKELQKRKHETYWLAHTHGDLRLAGINPNWKICPHFIMKLDYFMELGGLDCHYEYINHPLHDLAFRVQHYGGNIHLSKEIAFQCSHLPPGNEEHRPIEEAQLGPDATRFNSIYSYPDALRGICYLNYDMWKDKDDIWTRRFDPNNLQVRQGE